MLSTVGYESLDAFADAVVPSNIRLDSKTISNESGMLPLSESEMLRRATELSEDNEVFRSFIGMGGCSLPLFSMRAILLCSFDTDRLVPCAGYHQAVVPPVILRK